ncbi:histidine kinase [Actinocrispum sp. NPDC049592]|uniref:sensor histidine kinase n=1 Tax=Actinocrispum sp. NPDC049592 TaxID=3154835 RepID=UPI0034480E8A
MVELVHRYRDRPWWDPALAVVMLALALLYLTGSYQMIAGWPRSPVWMHLVCHFGICCTVPFRRTAAFRALMAGLVFVAADTAIGLSIPVVIVLIDLLYNATTYSSRRASRAIVGSVVFVVVALGITSAVLADDVRIGLYITLNGFSLLIVPVWWALNVRQQWEIAEAERENSRQLRRIAELDRQAAIASERSRMARDLHDVVAGHLSAIAIQSEALLSIVDSNPELVRTVLKSVRENSIQSLEEMRAMIEVLRDQVDDERTAPPRLAELGRLVDSARAAGLDVTVDQSDVDGLSVAVDLAAYRIVQEALTNAMKHAAGGSARVCLQVARGKLDIEVTNPMTGAPDPGGTGTGLVSMKERAHAVGGSFEAGPSADGWRVHAELPIGGVPR